MLTGLLWFLGGGAVTLFSYAEAVNSPYGGHYVIAWGAIVFGAFQFYQGATAAAGRVDRNSRAHELLQLAAAQESVDRAKAVTIYAEIIHAFPGTRASKEAQRNIKTLESQ
jgi:hypothetical protein